MKRFVVQTEAGLNQMCAQLSKHKKIAFDYEFEPLGGVWKGRKNSWVAKPKVVGCSFAVREGKMVKSWYVPTGHLYLTQEYSKNVNPQHFFKKIKPILQSKKILKIAHAAVVESGLSYQNGVEVGDNIHDTATMSWLYDENNLYPYRLKECSEKILGRKMETIKDITEGAYDISKIPIKTAAHYATDDSISTLLLHEWLEPELKQEGVYYDFEKIEVPMTRVLRDMVIQGVWIDTEGGRTQQSAIKRRIEDLEKDVYKECGIVFNINSKLQLGKILFDKLGYPEQGRTPTGRYKTDNDTMEALAEAGYPVAVKLQEHTSLGKLNGTYITKMLDFAEQTGGWFYPEHWLLGTVTGRFSGDFQQMPRPDKEKELYGVKISPKALVCAPPGYYIVCSDYSQLEYRLIAHFSKDPFLLKAYRSGEADFHAATRNLCRELGERYKIKALMETSRNDAKPINFGVAYGLTEDTLVERYGEEAGKLLFKELMERAAVLDQYRSAVHEATHIDEFTRTLSGKKRRLPEINGDDFFVRSRAERQSFNALIQGSAADLVKAAQIKLKRKLPELCQFAQVHDEIVGYVKGTKRQAEKVAREMQKIMESIVKLEVPLVAEPSVALNWRAAK